jgi:hypothetical protein
VNPLKRRTRGVTVAEHENRIQTLERRIPVDYPLIDSHLLAALTNISGPDTFEFGFTFPDECDDPTGVECEDRFVTSGNYLLLPSGFNGPFEVTMQCAATGGTFDNYLTPVTGGDVTPTDDLTLAFVAYVAEDNVVDTGIYFNGGMYSYQLQEPPSRVNGGYDRVWTHVRAVPANSFITESRRWALLPMVQLNSGVGPVSVGGLTITTKLYPPNPLAQASWIG